MQVDSQQYGVDISRLTTMEKASLDAAVSKYGVDVGSATELQKTQMSVDEPEVWRGHLQTDDDGEGQSRRSNESLRCRSGICDRLCEKANIAADSNKVRRGCISPDHDGAGKSASCDQPLRRGCRSGDGTATGKHRCGLAEIQCGHQPHDGDGTRPTCRPRPAVTAWMWVQPQNSSAPTSLRTARSMVSILAP